MSGFDAHYFGSYLVTDPDNGRLPYRFAWTYPKPTSGYKAHLAAGLAPETYPDRLYDDATHTLTVGWFDLSTTALASAINAAMTAIVPGVRWTVTTSGAALTLGCDVLGVEHSEAYIVDVDGRRGTAIDFMLTCTPGWQDAEAEVTLAAPESVPCVYSAADLAGSMPAPFRLALTNDQAVTGATVGFRHAPDAALGPLQDYQGSADATALAGEYAGATMTSGGAALGTPDTIDTNAHRGWWYACARLRQPDGTPADTTYLARSTVTASGMSGTQTFDSDALPATVTDEYEHVRLGPVPIPAGAVPEVASGSAVSEGNAVDDGTLMLTSAVVGIGIEYQLVARQTFETFKGQSLTFTYTIDTTYREVLTDGQVRIYDDSGGVDYIHMQILSAAELEVGTHTINLVAPIWTEAGLTYAVELRIRRPYSAGIFRVGFAYSNGDYAAGALTTPVGSGESAGDDLTFAIGGLSEVAFNSTVGIIAKNTGGGTGRLDTLALVPADEFAMLADTTHAADEGLLIDAMDPDAVTVYETDTAGGIGPVDQDDIEYVGAPHIWPGDTAIVYDAHTPGDAAPTAGDGRLWYKPTYLTPYGG